MRYDRKLIISGDIVELYDYQNMIYCGYERLDGCSYGRATEASEEQKKRE